MPAIQNQDLRRRLLAASLAPPPQPRTPWWEKLSLFFIAAVPVAFIGYLALKLAAFFLQP